jgi:hypothetical protein
MSLKSERRILAKDKIQSGIMVEFSYTGKQSKSDNYSIIVIDVVTSNGVEYLHGLLLENLSDFDIVRLSTEIGKSFNFDPDERKMPLTSLNSDEAYDRYKASIFKNDRRYRTFIMNNISNLQQILIGELS